VTNMVVVSVRVWQGDRAAGRQGDRATALAGTYRVIPW